MSQKDLADASGIDPSLLSKLLKGLREWKLSHLQAVSGAFNISLDQLFSNNKPSTPIADVIAQLVAGLDVPPDKKPALIKRLSDHFLLTNEPPTADLAKKIIPYL